jgi:hypothetical protein
LKGEKEENTKGKEIESPSDGTMRAITFLKIYNKKRSGGGADARIRFTPCGGGGCNKSFFFHRALPQHFLRAVGIVLVKILSALFFFSSLPFPFLGALL